MAVNFVRSTIKSSSFLIDVTAFAVDSPRLFGCIKLLSAGLLLAVQLGLVLITLVRHSNENVSMQQIFAAS